MTVEAPDHYGGKPIPEDAIEIALANAEREKEGEENTEVEAQETPLIGETNLDPSDYIQIPDRNILIAKRLWKYLSTGHRWGCWTWLDAKFSREKRKWLLGKKGKWKIAYDHEVQRDSNGNKTLVPQKTEGLESTLDKNCYVNPDFDRQGLPTKRSRNQKYWQGENISYKSPRDGAIARFYASRLGAGLSCNCYPSDSHSMLGVFACAEIPGGNQ